MEEKEEERWDRKLMGTLSSALFFDVPVADVVDAIKSERTNKNHHFPNLITTLVAAIIYL